MDLTHAEKILKSANGEQIEKIIIFNNTYWKNISASKFNEGKEVPFGKLLDWEEAKPFLDYTWDSGYGCEDCYNINAWTKSFVIFMGCYDGSTWVESRSRNPSEIESNFVGG